MATPFETHGAISWTELRTSDVAAAKKFYGELLGWQMKDMNMGPGMSYTTYGVDGQDMGGIATYPPGVTDMTPHFISYVTVKDIEATTNKAKALGAQILKTPTDIPTVGRFAVIKDPQGAALALIQYAPR